jgi:hypothetical protein
VTMTLGGGEDPSSGTCRIRIQSHRREDCVNCRLDVIDEGAFALWR